jgi:hypothetical protein
MAVAIVSGLIGLFGTLLTILYGRRENKKKAPQTNTRYSIEKQKSYKLLWENLENVEIELRSNKTTAQRYFNAVKQVNEYILKNALYLDVQDHELVNQYMSLLKKAQELVKKYSEEFPQVQNDWEITDRFNAQAIQEFTHEEQEIINQLEKVKSEILAKCRAVIQGV